MEPILRAQGVAKRYRMRGREVTALEGANLAVGAGEFVAVVGESGSGKSTLLFALGGLVRPDAGEVFLAGTPLYGASPAARARLRGRNIGFLFQTFHLIPYLTALENVEVPLYVGGRLRTEQSVAARRLLEELGLGSRIDHKPSELSVGQQQRVALARALVNEPKVLLADEPTGSLDPERAAETFAHLERANRGGLAVVLVTHDAGLAARAGRILRLAEGRVVNA